MDWESESGTVSSVGLHKKIHGNKLNMTNKIWGNNIETTKEQLPSDQQQKKNEKRSVFKSSYLCELQQTAIPLKIHVRALQNLQSSFQGETHLQRSEPVALSNTALRNDFHPYVSLLPLWISFSVNSEQTQTTLVRNECLHWSFLLSFWDVASVESTLMF